MQCTRFYLYFAVILEFVEKPGAGSLLSDQGRDGGVCLISPSIWPPDICNPASIWSYILSCAEAVWYFMTRKKKKGEFEQLCFYPVEFAIYLIFTRVKYKVLVLISCLFRKSSASVFSESLLCVCDSLI